MISLFKEGLKEISRSVVGIGKCGFFNLVGAEVLQSTSLSLQRIGNIPQTRSNSDLGKRPYFGQDQKLTIAQATHINHFFWPKHKTGEIGAASNIPFSMEYHTISRPASREELNLL